MNEVGEAGNSEQKAVGVGLGHPAPASAACEHIQQLLFFCEKDGNLMVIKPCRLSSPSANNVDSSNSLVKGAL